MTWLIKCIRVDLGLDFVVVRLSFGFFCNWYNSNSRELTVTDRKQKFLEKSPKRLMKIFGRTIISLSCDDWKHIDSMPKNDLLYVTWIIWSLFNMYMRQKYNNIMVAIIIKQAIKNFRRGENIMEVKVFKIPIK